MYKFEFVKQIMQNYTFTNEKFSITEDIFFTVDVTVIKGKRFVS